MKKYFFGILAIVLAISFSAFTNPSKKTSTNFLFEYTPPSTGDYSQGSVSDPDNWNLLFGADCSGAEEISCVIEVEPQFTHVEGEEGPTKLNKSEASNNVTLNTVQYSTTNQYGITMFGSTIVDVDNKPHI